MITDFRFRGASLSKKLFITLMISIMLFYIVLIIYPLFSMFLSSFKTNRAILSAPFALPASFDMGNFKTVWIDKGFSRYFANSLFVTGAAMAFVLLFGSMAAYGIARYTYRGNT
ncbi:MAG: carbohydrate ABC transporter permease, partial [Spirochaetales bacterium]|nr:carbohydrate ABC transporter permease [Spirochaetales bacterium]